MAKKNSSVIDIGFPADYTTTQILYLNMASKIKLLPEAVANQIAAGEVVDRPASVVKELLENSLDAGAGRISVEVEQGGKRMIRVSDDGGGMSREDALLCLERHATSKIRVSADLFAIHTLGFRGEALPSIASVSELTLVTREEGAGSGVRIQVEAGVIKSVTEVGVPRGAELTVRRLFYNVPARRKFLKNVDTEMGHITTLMGNLALARPDAHFSLQHDGRVLSDLPASPDLSGRLRHALGADALAQLVPVARTFEIEASVPLRVHGFVSAPSYHRSSTRSLHVFVNRRFVRDRLINHAVFEAYRTLLPKGRYPLVVLFLDLSADAVDVNVHPAKHEIRFRDPAAVHQAVLDALTDALKIADRAGGLPAAGRSVSLPFRGTSPPLEVEPLESERDPEASATLAGVADALKRYHEKMEREKSFFPDQRTLERSGQSWPRPSGRGEAEEALPSPRPDGTGLRFSELRVIGQVAGTYILAEAPDSLVVIDQHAAHERIMFERLMKEYQDQAVARQPLLFPLTLDLTYEEARRVEAHAETLQRLGLEVEPFGGNTVAIQSVPALLVGADPGRLLLELVDRLAEAGKAPLQERLNELFAVMACHSVVRANRTLSVAEMEALLRGMDEAAFPGHCPHGRDVVIRLRIRELAKWFGR